MAMAELAVHTYIHTYIALFGMTHMSVIQRFEDHRSAFVEESVCSLQGVFVAGCVRCRVCSLQGVFVAVCVRWQGDRWRVIAAVCLFAVCVHCSLCSLQGDRCSVCVCSVCSLQGDRCGVCVCRV